MAKNETIRIKPSLIQTDKDSFSALQAIVQSAKRTNENSPPIHRWDLRGYKQVVREADG